MQEHNDFYQNLRINYEVEALAQSISYFPEYMGQFCLDFFQFLFFLGLLFKTNPYFFLVE
jgi:hypothetical protein